MAEEGMVNWTSATRSSVGAPLEKSVFLLLKKPLISNLPLAPYHLSVPPWAREARSAWASRPRVVCSVAAPRRRARSAGGTPSRCRTPRTSWRVPAPCSVSPHRDCPAPTGWTELVPGDLQDGAEEERLYSREGVVSAHITQSASVVFSVATGQML